jgi:hypothetical protein
MGAKILKSGKLFAIVAVCIICGLVGAARTISERVNPADVTYVHLGKRN